MLLSSTSLLHRDLSQFSALGARTGVFTDCVAMKTNSLHLQEYAGWPTMYCIQGPVASWSAHKLLQVADQAGGVHFRYLFQIRLLYCYREIGKALGGFFIQYWIVM